MNRRLVGMVRLISGPVLVLLAGLRMDAQQMTQSVDELMRAVGEGRRTVVVKAAPGGETGFSPRPSCSSTPRTSAISGGSSKSDLMRRIGACEEAVKSAEAAHATSHELGRFYAVLGLSYEEEALWAQSEKALKYSVSLLRQSADAKADLAETLSGLGTLHIAMGRLREAEQDESEALRVREASGDRLLVAHSWNELAILYLGEHKYYKARAYAQRATDEFMANPGARPVDRVTVRYTLGQALCADRECEAAIPVLTASVAEAKRTMRADEFTIGIGEFLLGSIYWKAGYLDAAGRYMREGTEQMSVQLGWGHPSYLNALGRYAEYLRANRQMEAANDVERKIRQAQGVVDVRTLQTNGGAYGLSSH